MPVELWRPPGEVRLLALAPGAAWAAVLDPAGVVTVLAPGATVGEARVEVDPDALALALGDDGSTLAVIDAERRVRVIPVAAPDDARTLAVRGGLLVTQSVRPSPTTRRASASPHDLVFAPDPDALIVSERTIDDEEEYYGGGWIASSSQTTLVRWRSGTYESLFSDDATHAITYRASDSEAGADHAIAAAFSADGRWLAWLRRRGRLTLRAVAGGPPASPPAPAIRAFAFVPGAASVLTACGARVIAWDTAGERRGEFTAARDVVALACSPCGERVAYVDAAGDVTRASLGGAGRETLPRVHPSPARAVAWTGARVVIRCEDDAVLLWS